MTMNDDDEFSLLRRVFRKLRLQMIDDSVETIFVWSAPNGLRSAPVQPEIAPDSSPFCNTSPYPNPAAHRFCWCARSWRNGEEDCCDNWLTSA